MSGYEYNDEWKKGDVVAITDGMHKGSNGVLLHKGGGSKKNPTWAVSKITPNGFMQISVVQSRLKIVGKDSTPPTPAPIRTLFTSHVYPQPTVLFPVDQTQTVPHHLLQKVDEGNNFTHDDLFDAIAEEDAREVANAEYEITKLFGALSVKNRNEMLEKLKVAHEAMLGQDEPPALKDEIPPPDTKPVGIPPIPILQVSGQKADP